MAQTGKLGIADSRLGNLLLACAGAEAPSPPTGTMSARLGTSVSMLGAIVPALQGADGPRVFNMRATSALAFTQSTGEGAQFIGHPSPHWVLGGIDSLVGNTQLAYVEEDSRPLTATMTGKLGTYASSLGNLRLALGEQEGNSGASTFSLSAASSLSLGQSAGCQTAYLRGAANTLSVEQSLTLTKAINLRTSSDLGLGVTASVTAGTWVHEAGAANALDLAAQASHTASRWVHEVAASSALALSVQATSVTGTVYDLSATSALDLVDTAAVTADEWILDLTATSALDLAQAASVAADQWILELSADSPLALTQDATVGFIHDATADSTLALASTAEGGLIRDLAADSTLVFSQDASGEIDHVYEVSASSTLDSLDQNAGITSVFTRSASSALQLTHTLSSTRPWYVSAASVLQEITQEFVEGSIEIIEVTTGLDSSASVNAVLHRSARSPLSLQQATHFSFILPGGTLVSAENTLGLGQTAWITQVGSAFTTLALGQSADVQSGPLLGSELDLGHAAGVAVVRARTTSSELGLDQAVTYILVKHGAVDLYDYAPAGLPALQGPQSGVTSRFGLIYPADGPATDSVELRPPNLGNKDRLSFDRINRESRGGTLTVFADPNWPKVQTLALTFSGLRRTEAYELIRFVREHLGLEIKLSDWEQRIWRGVITTPDEPVVQDGKDSFSASFEFEGELLSA